MVPSKLIIPYALENGGREQPFTEDLELASILTMAEARRRGKPLEATVQARYPLLLKKFEKGSIIIDLLGLNTTKLRHNIIPDVDNFVESLEKVCEAPRVYLEELKRFTDHFKDYPEYKTIEIGCLVKPEKDNELKALVDKMVEFNAEKGPEIFEPVLSDEEIKGIFDSYKELRRAVSRDQKTLQKAKIGLRDSLDIARKVIKEEAQNVRDSSDKIQARLKNDIKKKTSRLKKQLDRDVARIKKKYRRETRPLRDERTKSRRKLNRVRKRIERLESKGEPRKKIKSEQKALKGLENKFTELDEAVSNLDDRMKAEVKALRERYKTDVDLEKEKLKEEQKSSRKRIKELDSLDKELRSEADIIRKQIDSLIRKKRYRYRSLGKYRIDLDVGDTEINIPFYLYQFGGRQFDYYPPVEVVGTPGLLSRFRRMLADSLESKINTLIRPQRGVVDRYLEKAVGALRKKTPVREAYREKLESLNLFCRKGSIGKMMLGLTKMRRSGWISDDEYIRLQEILVERFSSAPLP
ncbi:MAG: hypothetical protein PVH79_01480 [Candidatus Bathyarchaeota archaeon]|jgi:hypothetical protein